MERISCSRFRNLGDRQCAHTNQHEKLVFAGQGIHGEGKTYYDLKETYQIAILAKYQFFLDEELTHDFIYHDPKTHTSLGGKTRIITVEL